MKKISIVDKLLMLFALATSNEKINKNVKKCRNCIAVISIVFAVPMVIPAVSAAAPANVILAFDDGWNTVLDNAKPIMDTNGQKGVAFVITIQPDLAWNGLPDNYMNRAQLSQLYNAGWDLSSHSMTHGGYGAYCFVESTNTPCNENYLSLANNSQLEYELGQSKAWLDNNGYKNGSMFFAYPYGYYDTGLVNQIKAAGYYVAARTVDAYSWRYPTPEKPMKHPNYKIGDSDVLEMATYMVAGVTDVNDNVTTPQMIMDEINSTVSESGLLVLTFHKIVNGTPTVSEEYSKADFAKVSGYLKTLQNSGKVKVVTMSEYFGVPNPIPTYMPGTPLIAGKTIGKDWINVTWNAAPGNKTDVFDILVNNNIIYNVANKSINVTGLGQGSVKIQVYAINRSWGWTSKNDTPLVINETIMSDIVVYMPPTPINTTSSETNISWKSGSGNKTDYFNYSVNGTWHNNSVDTYYNVSGIGTGTIDVYAVNSTNGTTMNNTPLVINFSNNNVVLLGYEPPAPNNITSIIGSDYIITKWESGNVSGNGNITDAYNINVNGTWFNDSKDNFVNVTNLSSGSYTLVNVYAVNKTNGITVNNTPAVLNSSIPLVNVTPTPTPTPPHSGGSSGGSSGSSGSSSSGSSGGGGGGSFFDPNAEFFERQDTDIHNGTVSTIIFTKNGLVTEVTLNGTKNYGEATAVVSLLKKNPSNASIDGVYKFFSVNIGTIKHENERLFFKNPTITISLNNTNISDRIVKVYMFKNGSWIPVNTEITEKTQNKTYFKLEVDGFANFAVVFEKDIDGGNVHVESQHETDMNQPRVNLSENAPQQPTSVPTSRKMPGFEILIGVVVLLVTYALRKR